MRWVGFSGLAMTTTERLLRAGMAGRGEDPAEILATPRHVMGGECDGTASGGADGALAQRATRVLRRMRQKVIDAGGHGSALEDQLEEAIMYSTLRDKAPGDHGWEEYNRVVAADLNAPRWLEHSDGTEGERQRAKLTAELAELAIELGEVIQDTKAEWQEAAAKELRWRENGRDGGYERARVMLRAWRELTDGIPAHAAKFDQRWEAAQPVTRGASGGRVDTANGDCRLAARLIFTGKGSDEDDTFCINMVLGWMRLVRAEAIKAQRRLSQQWREDHEARQRAAADGGWMLKQGREGGSQEYHWREEEEEMAATGATSGAAAVIAKRKRLAAAAEAASPPTTAEQNAGKAKRAALPRSNAAGKRPQVPQHNVSKHMRTQAAAEEMQKHTIATGAIGGHSRMPPRRELALLEEAVAAGSSGEMMSGGGGKQSGGRGVAEKEAVGGRECQPCDEEKEDPDAAAAASSLHTTGGSPSSHPLRAQTPPPSQTRQAIGGSQQDTEDAGPHAGRRSDTALVLREQALAAFLAQLGRHRGERHEDGRSRHAKRGRGDG